jgi:diguanylate cyclase (GGDEF)-like protein
MRLVAMRNWSAEVPAKLASLRQRAYNMWLCRNKSSGSAAGAVARAFPLRRLWWSAVLLLGLSVSAVVWTIWQLRTDAIGAAIAESGNIATVLAGQLSRSLQAVDAVLLEIDQSSKSRDIDTLADFHAEFDRREFREALLTYRARLPQVFNIAIADKNGQIVVSTIGWPAPNFNVADRDYFINARTRTDGQLSSSIPINSRIDGRRNIVFARRLESSKGNFAGIVLVSVDTRYFEDIYGAVQSVHSLLFTLLNPDGIILFRHPIDPESAGKQLSDKSGWLESISKSGAGFRVVAQADGNVRFVSVRRVPGYPLFVNISIAESTALTIWRRRAAAIGFGSSVLLLFSIYLLAAIARQVRFLSDSKAALAHKSRELEHMACYDALTELANRTLFMAKVNAALARLRRMGGEFSVLMLDLDRFKTVNDSLGHPAGDALLKEVARRLQKITRDVDSVARFGGDEFVVLQAPERDCRHGVTVLADRILRAINEPYDLDGRKITLETSIGITLAPQDAGDADTLIKNADLALYKAKSAGRNRYCFFEAAMESQARERRELEDDMRKAITRNEFELHYQTIVDLERREYVAAEALVRWRHPQHGLVPPDRFIPLAEESGLIVPLGEWILRQACADAAAWPPHLKVAVNLSAAQFRQGNILNGLRSTLQESGLPPHRLELEITETVLLERNEENLAILRQIRSLGVSIVLDDFGTGYSSMRYLQMFPFDQIKIDQSFIQNMANHDTGGAIVCAIAGLGRMLDIATVAEGVETVEQLVFLRAAGCQLAQGYLFSRPVPASELTFERPAALQQSTKAA